MKSAAVFGILFVSLFSLPAFADVNTEPIVTKGKGALTCNGGGGQKALFSADCKQVSITRVSTSGGSIKYEITCVDGGNTTYLLACDAFAFEQKQAVF